jgi:hypothetical protein
MAKNKHKTQKSMKKNLPTAAQNVVNGITEIPHMEYLEDISKNFKGKLILFEKSSEEINQALLQIVAEAALDLWKIQQRLESLKGKLDDNHYLLLKRPVESALLRLNDAEIEIKDRTGDLYDYGMDELVLATEERSGSNRDVVAETIKPTVFYKKTIISRGEIIVGTPVKVNDEHKTEEEK